MLCYTNKNIRLHTNPYATLYFSLCALPNLALLVCYDYNLFSRNRY